MIHICQMLMSFTNNFYINYKLFTFNIFLKRKKMKYKFYTVEIFKLCIINMRKGLLLSAFIIICSLLVCFIFEKIYNKIVLHTPLTTYDKKELLSAMKMVHRVFEDHNIEYSLGFGSVLGSIRHKGFIPWDDDIDLFIFKKDIPQVKKALKVISRKYKVEKNWKLYKIHPTNNTYIDFFVIDFDENNKSIRKRVDDPNKDSKSDFTWCKREYGFDKNLIYPLKLYEFEDTKFWGPNDGGTLAKFWYGDDCMTKCKTRFDEKGNYKYYLKREALCNDLTKEYRNIKHTKWSGIYVMLSVILVLIVFLLFKEKNL